MREVNNRIADLQFSQITNDCIDIGCVCMSPANPSGGGAVKLGFCEKCDIFKGKSLIKGADT